MYVRSLSKADEKLEEEEEEEDVEDENNPAKTKTKDLQSHRPTGHRHPSGQEVPGKTQSQLVRVDGGKFLLHAMINWGISEARVSPRLRH
ncbi:hypothetical protein E2C01_093293 [Portunus trituberculatus]|uniref:Uncharacterized protein n=1 Tax=Portunus trituberculatus TaxID=210409 RepID=A0A5B7JXQ4_PORTR|nr:hypothetical protein [Portunus trituberculatus]